MYYTYVDMPGQRDATQDGHWTRFAASMHLCGMSRRARGVRGDAAVSVPVRAVVASGSCGGGVPQLSPAMVRQRPQLVGGVVGLALCASLACCAAGDGGLATTSRQRRRQQADGDLEVVHARLLAALLWSNDPAEINQCNVSSAHDYAQTLLP
eukprot:COSAG06_NODE_17166_length_957_cov_1.794872_1_plen_152_part_10